MQMQTGYSHIGVLKVCEFSLQVVLRVDSVRYSLDLVVRASRFCFVTTTEGWAEKKYNLPVSILFSGFPTREFCRFQVGTDPGRNQAIPSSVIIADSIHVSILKMSVVAAVREVWPSPCGLQHDRLFLYTLPQTRLSLHASLRPQCTGGSQRSTSKSPDHHM